MPPFSPYFIKSGAANPPAHTSLENHSGFPVHGLGSPWVQTTRLARARTGPRGEPCSEHHSCQCSFIHSFKRCSLPSGAPTAAAQPPSAARGPPPVWERLC